MPKRYQQEDKERAVRELEGGLKAPLVCLRHGIAERTLYRWQRELARTRAEPGVPPSGRVRVASASNLYREALRTALEALQPTERERVVGVIAGRLGLTPARARALFGTGPDAGEGRIGLTVPRRSVTAELAERFGKARWILVQSAKGHLTFERNVALSGESVVSALRAAGCKDVVVSSLCTRALTQLHDAGIRVWRGTAGRPALEQALRCRRGELETASESLVHLGRRN